MDTNTVAILLQALAGRQTTAAPTSDFWMSIAPSVILLIGAVVMWLKAQTITNQLTEAKTTNAETAAKADVTSKVVDKVAIEVNNKADVAVAKATDQETRMLTMTKEMEDLKAQNRALELKIAEGHVGPEAINKIVAAATAMRR